MTEPVEWPPLPEVKSQDPQADVKKLLYQAQLDKIKMELQAGIDEDQATTTANLEREKAGWANEYALLQADYGSYAEVAKEQINRATARAQFIQTAAAAISSAYAAILALSFSVTDRPLTAQGVAPTIFFGLSVVLVAVYLAFFTRPATLPPPRPQPRLADVQRERRDAFIRWTNSSVLVRVQWLHAAIISLGLGVALLPVAFLPNSPVIWLVVVVGMLCVFLPLLLRTTGGDGAQSRNPSDRAAETEENDSSSDLSG